MSTYEFKDFAAPDEIREFPSGRLELCRIGDGVVGRMELQPGWRWSECVKPIAGTEWCQAPHFEYHLQGTLHVIMATGEEFDIGPGECGAIPPGHDAYVVGDEPVIVVDWHGVATYAKR